MRPGLTGYSITQINAPVTTHTSPKYKNPTVLKIAVVMTVEQMPTAHCKLTT